MMKKYKCIWAHREHTTHAAAESGGEREREVDVCLRCCRHHQSREDLQQFALAHTEPAILMRFAVSIIQNQCYPHLPPLSLCSALHSPYQCAVMPLDADSMPKSCDLRSDGEHFPPTTVRRTKRSLMHHVYSYILYMYVPLDI